MDNRQSVPIRKFDLMFTGTIVYGFSSICLNSGTSPIPHRSHVTLQAVKLQSKGSIKKNLRATKTFTPNPAQTTPLFKITSKTRRSLYFLLMKKINYKLQSVCAAAGIVAKEK